MKIGIITFHYAYNFGAMLQAYALQSALEQLGHDAFFPHLRSDHQMSPVYRRKQERSVKGFLRALAYKAIQKKLDRRMELFDRFFDEKIKITRRYKSVEEMFAAPPDVDAYICGSDQIWNLEKGMGSYWFLGPMPDAARRISYAPSFGTYGIPEELRDETAELIQKIDFLSVRERQAVDLVKELTGRDAVQVCDPVFLLNRCFWEQIAIKPKQDRPYMVFYSLQSTLDLSACVSHLSSKYRLPVVVLAKGGGFILRNRTILALDSGPEEFLGWIRHASLVITNSFHATAFSIHFEVPFITVAHPTRNARMDSLLTCYHLRERLIHDSRQLKASKISWTDKPFTDESRAAVEEQKIKSLEFLRQATSV